MVRPLEKKPQQSKMDKLEQIFEKRVNFMRSLKDKKPDEYPSWPIDLSNKASQQHLRDLALRGVEEMFEALQHLKNWKPHRDTELKEFDREEFLEEVVDAFNYFFSVLILVDVDAHELFTAYCKKDEKIHRRLGSGY
jgi:NTP pyrophosphatase (non-canonical NTP hydrolase)